MDAFINVRLPTLKNMINFPVLSDVYLIFKIIILIILMYYN